MEKQPKDHPNIVVFPPAIPLVALGLAWMLQWLAPLDILSHIELPREIAGLAVALAGVFIFVRGQIGLARIGTNVNPFQPTTALAVGGIYGFTRNPIYVGLFLFVMGAGLLFAFDWLLVLFPLSMLVLHFGVVRREEDYLERKFGENYRRYKSLVPRYIGIPNRRPAP